MKGYVSEKLAVAVVLGLTFLGGMSIQSIVHAEVQNTTVAVNVQVKQDEKGNVNWEKGADSDVVAVGIGLPPENMGARGTVLARRAAVVDAQRNLAEIIQGVQIDSDTVMENLVISNDDVRTKVSALVKGARIIDEGTNMDGSYFVKMRIPIYGKENSIAAIAMPEIRENVVAEPLPKVMQSALSEAEVQKVQTSAYTGVVVDASGMGLEPTFSPAIYDINGRIVYGIKNLDYDFAISQGMVAYANNLEKATHGNRAGDNPMVVNAVGVRGGKNSVNNVNVVVSVEDGDKILLACENNAGILQNSAVVFVR